MLYYSFLVSLLCLQVFAAGAEICLKIREQDVDTIFEIIVDCKDASTQAQLMDALQAMAKVY